jgi:hypothetical protein
MSERRDASAPARANLQRHRMPRTLSAIHVIRIATLSAALV